MANVLSSFNIPKMCVMIKEEIILFLRTLRILGNIMRFIYVEIGGSF